MKEERKENSRHVRNFHGFKISDIYDTSYTNTNTNTHTNLQTHKIRASLSKKQNMAGEAVIIFDGLKEFFH